MAEGDRRSDGEESVNLLDNVRGALRKLTTATTPATSAEISATVAKAEAALEAARRRLAGLETKRASVLLENEGKRSAWRAELNEARDAVEDSELLLGELQSRHLAAVEAEAEAARRERYDEAKARADATVAALRKEYPAAAKRIVAMLRELAEAEALVDVVNGDLPAGAERLVPPEALVRNKPGRPDKTISNDVAMLWCRVHGLGPLGEERQGLVVPNRDDPKRGVLKHGFGEPMDVELRPFRRTRTIRGYGATILPPLAKAIELPQLEPVGRPFWSALTWATSAGVLAEVEKLSAPLPQPEVKEPEIVEEICAMRPEDVPSDGALANAG